jgi:hypothetical protein
VKAGALAYLECGECLPSCVVALARCYGVTLDELVGRGPPWSAGQ